MDYNKELAYAIRELVSATTSPITGGMKMGFNICSYDPVKNHNATMALIDALSKCGLKAGGDFSLQPNTPADKKYRKQLKEFWPNKHLVLHVQDTYSETEIKSMQKNMQKMIDEGNAVSVPTYPDPS